MFSYLRRMILILLFFAGQVQAGDALAEEACAAEPGRADMEVIAVMEVLQLMDLVESMDLINDIDILIEEEQNETQD